VSFFEKIGKKTSEKVEEAKLDQKVRSGSEYVKDKYKEIKSSQIVDSSKKKVVGLTSKLGGFFKKKTAQENQIVY